ncbi:YceI family protein [Skermania sp. ID1734]|uniref:YceI family protein n=1 Tax=Skermania sp. ID1734 TaxID=2597516 RepID=UPI001181056E|nr:YceI family protein [Skermania sp. ID1734]TSD93636.1 YceI family protein [Skermania sp. ID1734]
MTSGEWLLDESNGEVLIHTGVAGRAAKMGHRLTIAMDSWRATLRWVDDLPAAASLVVDVNSLRVLRGEGGLTPLSGPEKSVVRTNALKSLGAQRFPEIRFTAEEFERIGDGRYRVHGTVEIHGATSHRAIDVRIEDAGDAWQLSGQAEIRQTDFGVKPYSLLAGTLKVVDAVTVSVLARRAKD